MHDNHIDKYTFVTIGLETTWLRHIHKSLILKSPNPINHNSDKKKGYQAYPRAILRS